MFLPDIDEEDVLRLQYKVKKRNFMIDTFSENMLLLIKVEQTVNFYGTTRTIIPLIMIT